MTDGENGGSDGPDETRGSTADDDPAGDAERAVAGDPESPIEGQVILMTAAKASVAPDALPSLLDAVQDHLGPRLEVYRRRYELAHEDDERALFFVPTDHWGEVGERLDLGRREIDAVRRAHAEQLRRIGRREGRDEEFESSLEIRQAAVVGIDGE